MPVTLWWPDFCGNRSEYDAFWSSRLTIYTQHPRLTKCFENTVLAWTPCLFLWIFSPCYLYYLSQKRSLHGVCETSNLNKAKVVGAILIGLLSCLNFLWTIIADGIYPPPCDYVAPIINAVTMILIAIIMLTEYVKGLHTSVIGFVFWFLALAAAIIMFASHVTKLTLHVHVSTPRFATLCIYLVLVTIEFGLQLCADNQATVTNHKHMKGEYEPLLGVQKNNKHSPNRENWFSRELTPSARVSFFNHSMYWWCTSFILKGYRKPVTFDHLYRLPPDYTAEEVLPKFEQDWKNELEKSNYRMSGEIKTIPVANGVSDKVKDEEKTESPKTPNLFLTALKQIGWLIAMSNFGRMGVIVFDFASPLLLRALIAYINSDNAYTWQGILIALGFVAANFMSTYCLNYIFLLPGYMAGFRLRTIITSAVYRKALLLSSAARRKTTVGEIVNLMSVDAQKLQDMTTYYELVWSIPVIIALCMYFLYQTVGPACFAGLAMLMIIIPINAVYIGSKVRHLQTEQMVHKDSRVRLISEILSGIKVLKLYAWEPSFQKRVTDIRNEEIRLLRISSILQAVSSAVWFSAPYLVALAIFATYVIISPDNVLDADKAFVSLSLINLLNFPMSLLPFAVSYVAQATVSLKRVRKFLLQDEIDTKVVGKDLKPGEAVNVQNGTFSWGRDEEPVLKNINLSVGQGLLVAVVGRVGSGKSSLVSAMLGDLHKNDGSINVANSVAYVPQQAWIQNATVKDNILFGKPLDATLYENVVDACSLRSDFKILNDGDRTEIGEKGINLSGGQKQRVSLARAVYQDEDLYIMDDTLSAVDVHVGRHIFDNVIGPSGLLKNKTRILVTHGVNFLPRVDMIVVMENGRISEVGTYDELIERDGGFAEFIRTYLIEQDSDDETDPEVLEDLQKRVHRKSELSEEEGVKIQKQRKRNTAPRTSKSESTAPDNKPTKLIEDESSQQGSVGWPIIKAYVKAGGLALFFAMICIYILVVTSQVLANIWLSEWSADASRNVTSREQSTYRLSVYGYIGIAQVTTAVVMSVLVGIGSINAGKRMHNKLINRILRAPMAFFDTTPLGRIVNRMAKDMDIMDTNLPIMDVWFLFANIPVITTTIIISYSTPIFLVVAVPLFVIFFYIQRIYIATARQLKRIDSVRRSPLYVHFDESLVGCSVIRAYKRQETFTAKCDKLLDESQMTFYHVLMLQRWLGAYIPLIGVWVVFFAAVFAVISRDSISASIAGLSVSYALQITTYLKTSVRVGSDLDLFIVAVERINEYSTIESEASWQDGDVIPDSRWPHEGRIQFNKLSLRYRPGLDLVLKGIDCQINPGEKIGIVGRTGAGKSSLTLALFRLIEAAGGNLTIDGINTRTIGLHQLRDKITIIPQDPVIFSGSLRENLDPFDKYSDGEIWESLEHAHLKGFVKCQAGGLDYDCGEGGEALSVGQRQLLCLARALLRKNKILVLDEATAAVDMRTDDLIQDTIRAHFDNCTILTIAHRISTITDYDRVMVLDKGKVHEFDSPHVLMQNRKSLFHGLAREAGLI